MPSPLMLKLGGMLFALLAIGLLVTTMNGYKKRAHAAEQEIELILSEVQVLTENPKLTRDRIMVQLVHHRSDYLELKRALARARDSIDRMGAESLRLQKEAKLAGEASASRRIAAETVRNEALASSRRPPAPGCEPSIVVKRRWK